MTEVLDYPDELTDLDDLKTRTNDTQTVDICDDDEERNRNAYENLEQVVKELKQAAPTLLKRRPAYTDVLSFVIHWENVEIEDVTKSAKLMKETFEVDYKFEVEEIILGRENPYLQLQSKLDRKLYPFLMKKKVEGLVIIYYTGHGFLKSKITESGENTHCFWAARRSAHAPELDWTKFRRNLQETLECDVLFIFDCCHAEAMIDLEFERWKRRCGMLAAAGIKEQAGAGDTSFSRAVVKELQDRMNRVDFLASEIRASLSNINKINSFGLKATPHYDTISSLRLGPIRLGRLRTDEDSGSAASSTTIQQLTSDSARMLIMLHFSNAANVIKQEIEQFLKNHLPSSVVGIDFATMSEVKFHCLFPSQSCIVILSVPLWVWDLIPHSPACQALGIIRSGNLLESILSTPGVDLASKALPTPPSSPLPIKRHTKIEKMYQPEPARQLYSPDETDRKCESLFKSHRIPRDASSIISAQKFLLTIF